MDKEIKKLILKAIENKDEKSIYTIARLYDEIDEEVINQMTDALLEIGNPEYLFKFAEINTKVPVVDFARKITESGDAYYMLEFASKIENAPIGLLADGIINTGIANMIYRFAYEVKNSPKNTLAKAIIETKSQIDIEAFAYDVMQMSVEEFIKTFSGNVEAEEETVL